MKYPGEKCVSLTLMFSESLRSRNGAQSPHQYPLRRRMYMKTISPMHAADINSAELMI